MNNYLSNWKKELDCIQKVLFFMLGWIVLGSVFIINSLACNYAEKVMGAPINDILLDNLPHWDVSFMFHWGGFFFWAFIILYKCIKPMGVTFLLYSFSGFILIRSAFVVMTHLGTPEINSSIPEALRWYSFKADLFFSGHVGAPMLLGFIIKEKWIKKFSFTFAALMSFIVLLGRYHYTIDVFASIFIAHSLSVIAISIKDYFYKEMPVTY